MDGSRLTRGEREEERSGSAGAAVVGAAAIPRHRSPLRVTAVAVIILLLVGPGLVDPRLVAAVKASVATGCATTPGSQEAATAPVISVTWTQSPSGAARYGASTAFARTTCTLVAFGGSVRGVYQPSTLLFDPVRGTWTTLVATKTGPAARAWAGQAWDPTRSRVVMFGGANGPALQDTWAFDPASRTWSSLVANCRRFVCPPARWGHGMVWSTRAGQSIVFGGATGTITGYLDDLWTFDGSWHRIVPRNTGPSARRAFGMAEAPANGLVLIYGGLGPNDVPLSDTWLLDPGTWTWTRISPATIPDGSYGVALSWVGSIGMLVMIGGKDVAGRATTSTFAFDMTARTWVAVTATGVQPSARGFGPTLTADPCDGSAILFGDPDADPQRLPPIGDTTWIAR